MNNDGYQYSTEIGLKLKYKYLENCVSWTES